MEAKCIKILSTKKLTKSLIQSESEGMFQLDCIPFIETTFSNNKVILDRIKILELQTINAVFTSGVAVRAVAEVTEQSPNWNIFSLHSNTKRMIETCFTSSSIIETAKNGEELGKKILKYRKIKEAVFFCGNERMNILPELLRANHINLEEVVVYETKPTPHKIEKNYDAILFYSPSGVKSFFSTNKIKNEVELIAIGNTTADAIRLHCENNIHIAENANIESMIELTIKNLRFN